MILCEMFYNKKVVSYEMEVFTLREALGNDTLYFGTRQEMISPKLWNCVYHLEIDTSRYFEKMQYVDCEMIF